MRCLHCGKELALFKRLTGGGEFCSEAHKKSYQEEYNRIALTRLLQAQAKPVQPSTAQPVSQSAPPQQPAQAGVFAADAAPELEMATAVAVEELTVEAPAEPELEATGMADFVADQPVNLAAPGESAHQAEAEEGWLATESEPSAPEFLFERHGDFRLASAPLTQLNLKIQASDAPPLAVQEVKVTPYDVTPNEYAGAPENVPPPVGAPGNSLREAGPVIWTIAPCTFTFQVHGTTDGIVVMQDEVDYRGSVLLELDTALISFPAEDADVSFEPPAAEGVNAVGGVFAEEEPAAESEHEPTAEPAAESEPTPRESLQALARLHDEMAQQELAQQETAGAETTEQEAAPRVEAASAEAVVPAQDPEPTVIEPVAEEPVVIEPVKEEPVIEAVAIAVTEPEAPAEKDPRSADLRDMGLRVFAPPKPVPIDGSAMVREGQAILPRLTALPLRPKVAFAPSQSAPQTKKPMPKNAPAAQAEAPVQAAPAGQDTKSAAKPVTPTPSQPAGKPKPGSPVKPMAAPKDQKAPSGPNKPATTISSASWKKVDKPAEKAPEKAAEKPAEKVADAPQEAAAKAAPQKPAAVKVEAKPSKEEAPAKPKEQERRAAAEVPMSDDALPSFAAAQLSNASFLGSMKVKLGIAILLVAACATAYFGWGAKPNQPLVHPSNADAPGPSIMVGEGGWVENWAGDPAGTHSGRQITIYRPSLTLSDYRMEFQAQIDSKSVGWVFRATNPTNYYAMKLTQGSSGASGTLALFKYLVANGKQTQVGRVPVDLPAKPDTMYSIRLDARGPRFTTYIQGQQVDVWTDDQLKAGGVGFLNEREERGRVKSVSIYYLGNK